MVNDITDTTQVGILSDNPTDYLFVLEDDTQQQPFIMLDDADDKASSFFIYTSNVVAWRPWYVTQRFDPDCSDRGIAPVTINNDYLNGVDLWNGVSGMKLPDGFKNYIDKNHVWLTEGGAADGPCPNDYITTAAVSMLSLTEARKYAGKFGAKDNYIALRTPYTQNASYTLDMFTDGTVRLLPLNDNAGIRPCFWIGEDFFGNVRLDLTKTGNAVKKAIRERYTRGEMSKLYDEDELTALGYSTSECLIYNFKFMDENNDKLAYITKAGNILNVSATVANYTKTTPVTMIAAVYNDKGDMVAVNFASGNITAGQEVPMSVSVDLSSVEIQKGYTASVYF